MCQRSPSATGNGEPSSDEAVEQRISTNRRKQMGRRLLAAGSGLGRFVELWDDMLLKRVAKVVNGFAYDARLGNIIGRCIPVTLPAFQASNWLWQVRYALI